MRCLARPARILILQLCAALLVVGCHAAAAAPTTPRNAQAGPAPATLRTTTPAGSRSPKAPAHLVRPRRAVKPPLPALGAAPASARAPLRLATWNLKRLGHGTKNLDLVARVLADFDVVAVQEVMRREAIGELLDRLPGWKAAISERALGRSSYREFYAVLYRSDRVTITGSRIVEGADDLYARPPFIACFDAGELDGCLVTVHIVFGKNAAARNAEVAALGPLIRSLLAGGAEKDWVVVGDFNLPGTQPGWQPLRALGFELVEGNIPTTFTATTYRSPYDHVVLDRTATREWTGRAARYEVVDRACAGDFAACGRELSDHAPVWISLSVAGPDDD